MAKGDTEIKVNFGCFDRSIKGWTNVDFALKYIVLSKMPFAYNLAFKLGLLSKRELSILGTFRFVKYVDVRRNLG